MRIHLFNNGLMVEEGMSGSDRRALEWSKIFLKKGAEIFVYTSAFGQKRYQNWRGKFHLIVTEEPKIFKHPFLAYLYRGWKSAKKVKAMAGDILYSTSDLLPDSLPTVVNKLKNSRTIWITGLHLLAPSPLKKFSLRNIYYYLSQNFVLFFAWHLAEVVLVSNNLDRERLLKKKFLPGKVMVTYGAVNGQEIKKAKPGLKRYEAAFIGRYHPQKGLQDLLLVWQRVCQKLPQAKMVMIGELTPLLQKIGEMGLENNVEFLGVVDGAKKFSFLKSSKVFLFPSSYESFGLVAAEAMACGLPVVAYDLPIYQDIYPQGMVKVPLGNYHLFADQVIKLLQNGQLRRDLGKQARENAKRFSWEKTAEQIWKEVSKK